MSNSISLNAEKYYRNIEQTMARIESKWQKFNYSTDLFTEIAWEETQDLDFSPLADIHGQLQLLDLPGVRIQQKQTTFSDLYVQIFHNGRFMIEILNWWGGHVNVHDHDFSAVQFQLKGDALNVDYDFKTLKPAGALRFGELKLQEAEIWKAGGRSKVHPGADHPHSVFHIGEPTTSLLIRTTATPRYGAQSNYFPTLAAHYYVSNDIQRKKMTGLNLMSRKSPVEFKSTIRRFLNEQSASENFFMLLKLGSLLFQEAYMEIVEDFASRGEDESKIVQSVVINNGIDFFKTRANDTEGITPLEKLSAFAVAASHDLRNFDKLEEDLKSKEDVADLRPPLKSFISRLDENDRLTAEQYLRVFGLQE